MDDALMGVEIEFFPFQIGAHSDRFQLAYGDNIVQGLYHTMQEEYREELGETGEALYHAPSKGKGGFYRNGMRVYIDLDHYLEMCTPEVKDRDGVDAARELVKYEKAGEALVAQAKRAWEEKTGRREGKEVSQHVRYEVADTYRERFHVANRITNEMISDFAEDLSLRIHEHFLDRLTETRETVAQHTPEKQFLPVTPDVTSDEAVEKAVDAAYNAARDIDRGDIDSLAVLAEAIGETLGPAYIESYVMKQNTGPSDMDDEIKSFGSHENYELPAEFAPEYNGEGRKILDKTLYNEATGHMLARTIFTAPGGVHPETDEWILSPRLFLTTHGMADNTIHVKPFWNTRDEAHGDNYRLHFIGGDANMNETALYLKYRTTRWVLDGIVEDVFDDPPTPTAIPYALESRLFDKDGELNDFNTSISKPLEEIDSSEWALTVEQGGEKKTMTPVEIEEYYIDALEDSDVIPEEQADSFQLWKDTVHHIKENNWDKVEDTVEWVLKKRIEPEKQEAAREQYPDMFDELDEETAEGLVRHAVNDQYHRIDPGKSLFYHVNHPRGGDHTRKLFDHSDGLPPAIKEAMVHPPDTRAADRVADDPRDVDWVYWDVKKVNGYRVPIREPDR